MTVNVNASTLDRAAALDAAHVGHIQGAFGAILHGDVAPRKTLKHRFTTLLAILGPGLIVMAGDNDAGAFATYGQAGQTYGTTLLWVLVLLIPVLYVNQEMVLRLGAVTGVGHARLIFERFGKFWGAFSVIDLFLLNALTIVTEFIGISLALDYLGLQQDMSGVCVAGGARHRLGVSTGSFRRFERFSMALVVGSLLLLPIYFLVHPPFGQVAHDFVVPAIPATDKTERHDAARHRPRRHDGRALAIVLPAELRHRQAHHAALHPLRAARPVARHRARASSAPSRSSPLRPRHSRASRNSAISPTPAALPRASRNMPARRRA